MAMQHPPTVDDYLARVLSDDARVSLARLREIIHEEIPQAQEVISYGMPAFKLKGPVVWFGAFKNHCSFFAGYTVGEFADELKGYKTSKGTIQFSPGKPLPESLVRAIVRARLAETDAYAGKPVRARAGSRKT